MKKLISLPNGAFVDGTRVIEISNVYRDGEDFIVRVALEGGTIHILEHSVEWKAGLALSKTNPVEITRSLKLSE